MRKIILYIACSIDGYIAASNDDLSFLDTVESQDEDYGYNEFMSNIDTVIMGRKTHDWLKNNDHDSIYENYQTFIFSNTNSVNSQFYNNDLIETVKNLKNKTGKNIFCVGGSQIFNLLLKNDMIDEMIISIIPIVLGNGIPLFTTNNNKKLMRIMDTKTYPSGLVQLHYKIKNF